MNYEESKRDIDAVTEPEIFEEASKRLELVEQAESKFRSLAKDDARFVEGEQWANSPITTQSAESPELTINLLDAMVTRVENNIRQQRPRGKAHPVSEGATIEMADVINGLGRHVEARSDASVAYDMAAKHCLRMGVGYWRLLSEYVAPDSFQQDLRICPIRNPFTVYVDPAAIMPTAQDMSFCIISTKIRRTEYRRMYPRAGNEEFKSGADVREGWEEEETIRLAEYFRVCERSDKLYLIRGPGDSEYTRFRDRLPAGLAALVKAGGEFRGVEVDGNMIVDVRDSSQREVQWFRLNGVKVVDRRVLPGSFIPVFRVEGNVIDIDGDVKRRGMVRNLKDPQKMVNYGEVSKIRRLGLAPKAPWVGAEGQFDGHPEWDNANVGTYSKLVYKPVIIATAQGDAVLPPPTRQPPAQIEAGFAEFVQGMRTNLLAVAGMQNEPGADMQGQVVSGKAIQRRQGMSDQAHYQYYDNVTLAIAQTWRVMLEWFPKIFSEARMQRIIGDDGQARMVGLNTPDMSDPAIKRIKNDLSVGRYDVVMDTGPGYETKREEGSEALLQLLGVPALGELIAKVGADLVIRSIDHPYMQELADRISAMTPEGLDTIMEQLPERARSIVRSLANDKKQLQGQVQQLETEVKLGLQKAHLAAVTKVHDTQTRAQTAAHDVMTRAQTERDTEEIRAGAGLMEKAMEHGQESRMAQLMIERGERAELNAGEGSNDNDRR